MKTQQSLGTQSDCLSLGKGEVESSILSRSTSKFNELAKTILGVEGPRQLWFKKAPLQFIPAYPRTQG